MNPGEHPPPPPSRGERALAASALAVVLAGGLLLTARNVQLSPLLLGLSLVSVALELLAVPQKRFGLFSAAFPCTLAVALLGSPALACLVALSGVTLRTLVKGARTPAERWREAVADLVAQLAPLAFVKAYGSALGAVLIYLPLSVLLPGWLAEELEDFALAEWRDVRWLTSTLYVALGFLGVAMASLGPACWWLVPVLLVLHRAANVEALKFESLRQAHLREKEERTRLELALAQTRLERTEGELRWKVEERTMLEDLARKLAASPGLDGARQAILQALGHVARLSSVALFDERLQLREAHGQGSQIRVAGPPPAGPQPVHLVQSEPAGLLLPMATEGMLYVGRTEGFSREELGILSLLAGQGGLGLQSARRFEELRVALARQEADNQVLMRWVEQQGVLLEGSRIFAATLDSAALLDRFAQLAMSLVPHRAGAILVRGQIRSSWPAWAVFEAESLAGLGRGMLAGTDVAVGSASLLEGCPAVMAVLLADEEGPCGAIFCLAESPEAFGADQQRLMAILAHHLTTALRGSSLHARVLAAHRELKETQAQLVHSSKLAAVGQLAAGIAHELNSPLAAIIVALDTMSSRLNDPAALEKRLTHAGRAAGKAQRIIEKLLHYAHADAEHRPVDVNQIVADTLELFGNQVERDGARVERELASDAAVVLGNENELQQVLLNLLLNARDAIASSEDKTIRVTVRREGGRVVASVCDRGPGIEPVHLERIFEPFYTTKPVGDGTGLGLSVSHQIVKAHGGTLDVKSAVGEGACFTLGFPALEV